MSSESLTSERILDTAEGVLRRHGIAKTTVVDVARALGVSHGSIYRHFPTKVSLHDAVAARWLARVADPLADIAHEDGPADERLRRWLRTLAEAKRRKVLDDPELFHTYHTLAEQARGVVDEHVRELTDQLTRIIRDGAAQGRYRVASPEAAARGVFDATVRFHHPAHSREWGHPGVDADFDVVVTMIQSALAASGAEGGERESGV
ncbi:TetR family transcriptional regulator [Halostreptopolyspora alba]|uniref:TetR/AcrR family transcriptional regulator n=1 Tax=Halostreptopolyspora alba TaxID=2487137 RepID=A0A3N0EE44_9ACTN|nr:TetR/AcrR family transcriptional regulator [Nocardiopsaceae bacterium YIM 96095]